MKRMILAAALAVALAGPALGNDVPGDMAKVDAALAQNPQLPEDKLAYVKELRAEAEKKHAAGDEDGALDDLAVAKDILGIE